MNKEYLVKVFAREWLFLVSSFLLMLILGLMEQKNFNHHSNIYAYRFVLIVYSVTVAIRLTIFSIKKLKNKSSN
jgi:hypothetical protein